MSCSFKSSTSIEEPVIESARLYSTTAYFRNSDAFHDSLESYGEGLPLGWRLFRQVHRDRVVLLANDDRSEHNFRVCRYSHRMKRTDLFHTTSSSAARAVFQEWQSMTREELGIGLYIATSRPPAQLSDIPQLALRIACLHVDHQQGIWALIRAGVPGDMAEIFHLSVSCGLIPQTS